MGCLQEAVQGARTAYLQGLAAVLQQPRCCAWSGSFGKDESLLHGKRNRHSERRGQHSRSELALPAPRGAQAGCGALQSMQRSVRDAERSCCRWPKHRVHEISRSRGNQDSGPPDRKSPNLQNYSWLRRQCPLSVDHAQRDALREGEGCALHTAERRSREEPGPKGQRRDLVWIR